MSWLDTFGIGNMASSFLHPEKGYQKGQNQLDKYYREGQGYLQPYNQFGQNAYGDYSNAMKRLLDPAALQDEWTRGYTESDAAKNTANMARENGLDAASSLGLMGSNTALNAIQGGTTNIGLQDRQNYLDNLMQKYLAGTGIAGNIFGTGAGAAGSMSTNAANMGNNSAQLAFGKQNAPGDLFGRLLGTAVGAYTGRNSNTAGTGGAATGGGSGWFFGG
jgi:hypothetical protein